MISGTATQSDGLLARIMRRLGLEKQLLLVRRHLGVVIFFLFAGGVGTVLAVTGIRRLLVHSSFGPYLSLLRSDFGFIAAHRAAYLTALSESAPTALIAVSLAASAVVLLCIRLTVVYAQNMSTLVKSIHHS